MDESTEDDEVVEGETHLLVIKMWVEDPATALWRGYVTDLETNNHTHIDSLSDILNYFRAHLSKWLGYHE
jgi:hypothetical protein